MSDLIGHTLGAYQIIEQLGQGGMATVYKAYQPVMDRYVAIKILPRHMGQDTNFRARFQRETRTIAKLEHRYILPVHDSGEQDGICYMVMRYTEGGTLSSLLATERISIERATTIIAQIAEALGYAHRQGVIHRDVKPANILITRDGDAQLSDFGIAKIIEGTMQLTSDGMLIGTPYYMAPEQVQGKPADARTDIYALGVVLYEALLGKRPYEAETPIAVALMHLHEPLPPPRSIRADLPESLERIILRCMAKNPEDRFQRADDLADALRATLGASSSIPASSNLPNSHATILLPNADTTIKAAVEPEEPSKPEVQTPTPKPAQQELPATPKPVQARYIASIPPTPPVIPNPRQPPPIPVPPRIKMPKPRRKRGFNIWPILLIIGGIFLVSQLQKFINSIPADTKKAAFISSITNLPAIQGTLVTDLRGAKATLTTNLTPSAETASQANPATQIAINQMITHNDDLWVATSEGLIGWHNNQATTFNTSNGMPFDDIRNILPLDDGTLIIAGYPDLIQIKLNESGVEVLKLAKPADLKINYVKSIIHDEDDSLLAGGYLPSGLVRYDGKQWQAFEPAIPNSLGELSGDIQSILRGSDGALWLGTDIGIFRLKDGVWSRYGSDHGAGEFPINNLIEAQGSIWAAAADQGLLRYLPDTNNWIRVPIEGQSSIYRVMALSNDTLWVASDEFIAQSRDKGTTWSLVGTTAANQIHSNPQFIAETENRIWVGGVHGLSIYEDQQWRVP